MDVPAFIKTASRVEFEERLSLLVASASVDSLSTIKEFLCYDTTIAETDTHGLRSLTFNPLPSHFAALALIQKGSAGVDVLLSVLTGSVRTVGEQDAFGALWWAAKGKIVLHPLVTAQDQALPAELVHPPTEECVMAAQNAVNRLTIEARTNPRLFGVVLRFLAFNHMLLVADDERAFVDEFYEVMTTGAIKLSRGVLQQFEELIRRKLREEEYQAFLMQHPVFLDPLASDVFPKQRLGVECITDFALRRYDGKYVLVEIEKPQDALFTAANDFTAAFTHAYGQVLDFQQWVDSHGEYARKLMPGISSPRGLLVMGLRSELTNENKWKLHRLCANSVAIDVVTFDDLLVNATSLYEAILRKGNQTKM